MGGGNGASHCSGAILLCSAVAKSSHPLWKHLTGLDDDAVLQDNLDTARAQLSQGDDIEDIAPRSSSVALCTCSTNFLIS